VSRILVAIHRSFVSSIELGKTNPSLLTVLKLCKVIDIQDLNFLLGK
jgi:DNA-binding XRE family transcriptional regulator